MRLFMLMVALFLVAMFANWATAHGGGSIRVFGNGHHGVQVQSFGRFHGARVQSFGGHHGVRNQGAVILVAPQHHRGGNVSQFNQDGGVNRIGRRR